MSDQSDEVERLRARVAELEAQLAEQAARANAAIAAAEDRAYWLDRWRLDLNALMESAPGRIARALAGVVRAPVRVLRRLRG
jgi:cell division septum initiation protein DivIVA